MPEHWRTKAVSGNGAACFDPQHQLVAGTSWLFAPEFADEQLDYLVIDEAGQLSLADALAAGTSARNLILLGDPLQLPHVSQAIHPGGTSAERARAPARRASDGAARARALPRPRRWRMHPDVCTFISERGLRGASARARRLRPAERRRRGGDPAAGRRARRQRSASPEEAEAIRAEIERLLGQPYVDMDGRERPLRRGRLHGRRALQRADAPAAAQALPDGVRIGTVDGFQGQEAPVVFFSMATSSGEDVPRDIAFLFSRNRLNVAISRARCLAYLVCAPTLLETHPKTLDQMRLISTLCALSDAAAA